MDRTSNRTSGRPASAHRIVAPATMSERAFGPRITPSPPLRASRRVLRDRSERVHELVHHFQNIHKLQFRCAAEREELAYALQLAWLQEQGVADPYELLGINHFFVVMVSVCRDADNDWTVFSGERDDNGDSAWRLRLRSDDARTFRSCGGGSFRRRSHERETSSSGRSLRAVWPPAYTVESLGDQSRAQTENGSHRGIFGNDPLSVMAGLGPRRSLG